MKRNFIKSKKSGRMVTNVWKYALAVVLLSALGVNDGWASSSDYARGYAEVSSSSPSGAGKVYVAYTSSGGSQPATPAASSSNWKTSEASAQAEGTKTTFDFYYYSLPTSGYALEGWSETNGASDYSNAAVAKYSITTSSCSLNDAYTDVRLYAHFVPNPTVTVTFLTPDPKCTYTVQCDGANVPIGSSKTTNKSFNLAVTVNDANYKLLGWYTTTDGGTTKSYFSPNTTYSNKYFSQTCSVGVELVEAGKPVFMVGNKLFTDLNAANAAASSGSNKTIVLVSDGMLDAGNYTISSGNTLLIPHTIGSTFVNSKSVIDAPYIVKTAAPLSAFRKLTLQDGVNITVNGMLCVAGKMMSSGGGKPSAYPTGEIGMIDMSAGGNITLNGTLYCWGFIKGQDMDQGNNTIGVGTITVNSGATVWEGFATGDWRGGSASSTLYSNASSWKFFPFQSYTIQNIEVPVTYNYGSKLSNYMSIFGDGQVYNGTFDLIGSSNTLFKLSDSASKLKKWYNPQTDLVCYEMSGTTQLDALNVDAAGETVSSADYNLPISTSMHIILASNTTISKPVEIQAGAVIEVKSGVTATCSSNVYVFDKDQWGEYCNSKYYYTMSNLTSHKDRGDGKSNEMIDDAKMIIDGTLNVTGKLYTTTGGADIMGNGGGKIAFNGLGSSTNMVMCTGVSDNENVAINQACLHNEDDSYTKAIASTTFHNVNGRWFKAAAKDEKANHTYDFTYISSGAVSGTGGTNTTTSAVYSNDKTGLETRMKWANVTADGCADWWQGQGEQSTFFYNWTLNSAWHQFIPTEMENVYSGSNNKLYEKSSCTWGEIGETDEDCLYTISGVKKALVDGHFIALEANSNDPAFHLASDATQYYICFAGCNWHEATKYEGENKAYIVDGGNYIWYDGAWLNVQRQEPFFYTLDASNAQVCYEYVNGDWQIALPYVRVSCPTEPDRNLYFFNEALTVASAKKNATITILRDIPDVKVAGVFTGVNTNCTLNLNGHTVTGSVNNLLTVNASGSTFTITDETTEKEGKLNLEFDLNNTRYYTLYVQKGTVVMENGTIAATNTLAYNKTSAPKPLVGGINVAAGATYTMNGGNLTVTAPYNPIGINSSGSASAATTVNINSGSTIDVTATTIDSPYGMYGYATVNFNGGTMNVTANKSTKAYGFHVLAYYKSATNNYVGILNLKGGTVTVKSQGGTAYGIQVNRAVAYDTNEPRNITAQYLAEANISGGELNVITPTKTTAIGISTQGTVDFYGGTINVTPATTTAFGIRIYSGETKIRNTAQLNVTATSIAYGVRISEEAPTTAGLVYKGTLTMSGGKITVNTTSTTDAYGVYVGGLTLANSTTNASNSKSYAGNYASFGTANISGGEIDVKAKTTKAYDIYVKGAVTESGAEGYAAASSTPKCTITGGKYKLQSLTGATTEVAFTNDAATTDNYKISAGYYDNNVNLEDYTVSPAHVVTLPATDANYPEYTYKVAEAYTVTFKNGDETLQSSYQEKGKTPVYLGETPTKASTTTESYIFDGWSTSDGGSIVAPLPNVTSAGATYYAHYNTTALKYIVSLDAVTNGGSCGTDKIYVEPSTAVGELPVATKTGHTFSGWYTAASGGTKLESTTTITADGTYYAQFTVNSYTLTWVLDGGKVSTAGKYGTTSWPAKNATGTQSKAIPFGSALTAPVVARTGYTFQTWSPLVAGIMPAEATTYTAIWLPNSSTAYTVKHYQQNVDGTYPTTPFETESLTGTTATSVTPETKTYDGFISPATQTATIAADGSMVVEYQYARRHYTFTLDAATNGGTSDVPSIEVIHGATIGTVPPDAQKGCNDFTGWYTKAVGGVKITSAFVIEYDMKTLYAQFSDDIRTYPITYLPGENGTGAVAAETKTCGVNTTLSSSTFTRTGYTQTGWSTTDGGTKTYELGGAYTANAALTLYPFWTINQYTISFNSAGGSAVASITQDYNTAVTAPANPTKTGYTFSGWDPAVPNPMPAENTECVAQWTINQYTISFNSAGGSDVASITQDYNTAVTAPANPTKTGYTFAGWDPAVPNPMPAENTECVAQWTINSRTLAWNWDGGETSSADYTAAGSVVYGTALVYPADNTMTKANYVFSGWSTDATTMPDEDLTITAQWTPAKVSVTVSGATTYYTTLPLAFAYAADKIEPIITVLDDITLSAKVTYTNSSKTTVTFDLNGHTVSGAANQLLYLTSGSSTGGTFVIKSSVAGGQIRNVLSSTSSRSCVYLYKGKLKLESGTIYNENTNTGGSYAVLVASSRTFTMTGGKLESKAPKSAYGLFNYGTSTISGGNITATENSSGTASSVYAYTGTTTLKGTLVCDITGTTGVYGAFVGGATPASDKGTTYNGTLVIEGGTFNVTANSSGTAYGVYCTGNTRKIDYSTSATYAGNYADAGTATIKGGVFTVEGKTTYGVGTKAAVSINTAKDADGNATYATASATPKTTITGGKFHLKGTTTKAAVTTTATNTNQLVQGGWYNINTNLSGYVAPTKSCNYWELPLDGEDPYQYEVAEAYNVTFNANGHGTAPDAQLIKKNGTVTEPDALSETGYTFGGWYKEAGCTNAWNFSTDKVTATTTLYAKWTVIQYTISFDSNGGSEVASITQDYNTSVTAPADPTKTGYTFAGWTPAVPGTMPAENTECVAQWTPNANTPYVVKHYQQNIADDDYTEVTADRQELTGTTATEVTPAVKNYTGFTAPSTQTVTILADGSRVVEYYYTRDSYTLTWDANGGELSGEYTSGLVKFGAAITAPTATQENYDFDGWHDGTSIVTPAATMPAENKTYTAQWTLAAVTILWKSEDGTDIIETDDLVAIGSTPSFDSAEPTKATTETYTYTFDGWSTTIGGDVVDPLPAVTEATTYYAHFTATANVASVKVGSADPTFYTDFEEAWEDVNSALGTVTLKLLKDVEGIATSLAYTNAQNCTFDLNNHTLSGTVTKLIDVNASGKIFTIDDSSDDKGGKISMVTDANARVYCLFITAGEVHLNNGTIYSKNTHTYSSATANKSTAATAVYVTKSQKFIMDDGTVESEAQRSSFAILADKAGTTTITINGGLVKGHTNKSTTAAGIYTYAKGLTVNSGRIVGHSWTSTAYGILLYGGSATLNGGEIEATNDTINSAGTTTTYGVYVRYSSSSYKGVLTVPAASTVKVLAKSRTTTACAVYVYPSSTASTIAGGTFTAIAKTSTTARGIFADGNITVSGGTFNVYAASTTSTITTVPCGIYAPRGTVTVNGSPTFNVTSGASRAYGAFAYGTINDTGTGKYSGTIKINGGTFNVTTTTTTAYGALAGLYSKTVAEAEGNVAGTHRMPGIIEITDGIFNVTATTNTAYGVYVSAKNSESGDVGTTVRIPTMTVTGAKFKITSKGDASKAYAMNNAADNTALVVEGGFYSTKKMNSGNIEDKYTAPTKDCNFFTLETTEEDKATVGSDYNYKVVEIIDIGDRLDIIDWTTTTLTINANGWAASGWPYTINGTPYEKEARAADRTLTIPYSAEAGTDLRIRVQSGGSLTSLHYYTVPFIGTTEGAGEEDVVYVNEGTLTISSNTTLAALYIRPEASVEVTSGTLTVGKLVMRTLPWQAAAISGNFTASETWYTRIAPNKRTITGPYAPITYESARYYQFALPRACTEKLKDIQVSNAANTPYGNTWLLKRYNEETRAEKGIGEANWVALGNEEYIQGGVGYEMFSNSNYYREFYFPLGAVSSASLGNTTAVSYDMGAAGEKHAGWNWVSSPLMSVYDNSDADPEEGMKIGILMTDGSYDQGVPEYIYPAIPFSYQASEGQSVISFEGSSIVAAAPQRRAAADEFVRKQWIHVNIQDEDGIGDHTSILAHPTRYEQTYKTGIDVAKQSFTALRPLIYSSHTYGEMAFAAVADSLLEIGIPLTVYSPKPQELTISMRDNNWLDRLAEVWLVDMETGAQTDLFDSDYTFEATEGTTRGRIFLMGRFKAPNIATDIETTEANEDQNMKAQKLIIRDKLYIRLNGQLYDATGKLVNDK